MVYYIINLTQRKVLEEVMMLREAKIRLKRYRSFGDDKIVLMKRLGK